MTSDSTRPGPVCRSLFQSPLREETTNQRPNKNLRATLDRMSRDACKRWNFDFQNDRPLEGTFKWTPVSPAFSTESQNIECSGSPACLESVMDNNQQSLASTVAVTVLPSSTIKSSITRPDARPTLDYDTEFKPISGDRLDAAAESINISDSTIFQRCSTIKPNIHSEMDSAVDITDFSIGLDSVDSPKPLHKSELKVDSTSISHSELVCEPSERLVAGDAEELKFSRIQGNSNTIVNAEDFNNQDSTTNKGLYSPGIDVCSVEVSSGVLLQGVAQGDSRDIQNGSLMGVPHDGSLIPRGSVMGPSPPSVSTVGYSLPSHSKIYSSHGTATSQGRRIPDYFKAKKVKPKSKVAKNS